MWVHRIEIYGLSCFLDRLFSSMLFVSTDTLLWTQGGSSPSNLLRNILENCDYFGQIKLVQGVTMSATEEKNDTKPIDSDYYKWSKQISASKKVSFLS